MPTSLDHLRSELAVAAARLIADEGCDYGQAKRRAMRELLGDGKEARGMLPDNAEVERELRRHLRLFAADTHPELLAGLRRTAERLMEQLAESIPLFLAPLLMRWRARWESHLPSGTKINLDHHREANPAPAPLQSEFQEGKGQGGCDHEMQTSPDD